MSRVLSIMLISFMLAILPVTVSAAGLWGGCENVTDSVICDSYDDKDEDVNNFVGNLMDVLIWIVGVAAVIMIIVGGVKYITSGGDANKLTSAKNTILYSVVGLVVALFAYAIVTWIIGGLQPQPGP